MHGMLWSVWARWLGWRDGRRWDPMGDELGTGEQQLRSAAREAECEVERGLSAARAEVVARHVLATERHAAAVVARESAARGSARATPELLLSRRAYTAAVVVIGLAEGAFARGLFAWLPLIESVLVASAMSAATILLTSVVGRGARQWAHSPAAGRLMTAAAFAALAVVAWVQGLLRERAMAALGHEGMGLPLACVAVVVMMAGIACGYAAEDPLPSFRLACERERVAADRRNAVGAELATLEHTRRIVLQALQARLDSLALAYQAANRGARRRRPGLAPTRWVPSAAARTGPQAGHTQAWRGEAHAARAPESA